MPTKSRRNRRSIPQRKKISADLNDSISTPVIPGTTDQLVKNNVLSGSGLKTSVTSTRVFLIFLASLSGSE